MKTQQTQNLGCMKDGPEYFVADKHGNRISGPFQTSDDVYAEIRTHMKTQQTEQQAEAIGYAEASGQFKTQGAFSSGQTWDDNPELNEAYDRGVNRAEADHMKTQQTPDKYTLGPDCDSGCLDQGVRVCGHEFSMKHHLDDCKQTDNPSTPAQAHSPLPDRSTKAQWEKLANEAISDSGYWKREARKAQTLHDGWKKVADQLQLEYEALKAHAQRLSDELERCRDLVIAYRKAYCTSYSADADAAIKSSYQALQDFGVPNAQKGGQ